MAAYEHIIQDISNASIADQVAMLDELSADGWEIVTATESRLYLRKEKAAEKAPRRTLKVY